MEIKTKNLIVLVYALFILGLGFIFLSQSSKLGSGYLKTGNTIVKSNQVVIQNDNSTKVVEKSVALAEVKDPVYSYEVVSKSLNPKIELNQTSTVSIKIRNTGNVTLYSGGANPLYLAASHPQDRTSVFYNNNLKGWISANRIKMNQRSVEPGGTADFVFQIKATNKPGIYREFFTPVIEKIQWLDDAKIFWDITVIDPNKPDEKLNLTVDGNPEKYIKIKLSEQYLYAYENNEVIYKFQTSTGKPGMDTPTGNFAIQNKFPVQYSSEYQLYIDNWMAITPGGAVGIHSLPYWPAKNGGRIYEGEGHLGTKVSHGCIRVSLENSKLLFDWAEIGTPVIVED